MSSAKYHQAFKNPEGLNKTIRIRNLMKNFGQFFAVNGVSLDLYEQQIFCLLGHNGAGKTTTINLLTGLIEKSVGKVQVYNMDLDSDLEQIRLNIGLCTQKDILYEHLTVEEHLRLILEIKMKDPHSIPSQIEEIIERCGLDKERGKQTRYLSGGNKRKLSLGMALIGESQIIFLDEPSSGMDPVSRRSIWKILEKIKNEKRTIILTTHHLEEAEHLADRIGIMARGKLLTVGTCEFIKKKFGVGYHLNVYSKSAKKGLNEQTLNELTDTDITMRLSEEKMSQLKTGIQSIIPESKWNPQAPLGSLLFTLPFYCKDKFSQLFKSLEDDPEVAFNLEMNSLEDAFINIGMDEERFFSEDISNMDYGSNQEKYTNFDQIEIPKCMTQQVPEFRFWVQFWPVFWRKYRITVRSIAIVIAFFMPILFLSVGLIISKVVKLDLPVFQQIQPFFQLSLSSSFSILAFCFSSTSWAGTLIMEREFKIKYSLNVMGCRPVAYWCGTFVFDYIMFLLNFVLFIVITEALELTVISENYHIILPAFLIFGISMIPLQYLVSYLFDDFQSGSKLIIWINYLGFFVIPSLFSLAGVKVLTGIISLSTPPLSFYFLFVVIGVKMGSLTQFLLDFIPIREFWPYFVSLGVQTVLFVSLTLYLDYKKQSLSEAQAKSQELGDLEQQSEEKQDILQEINRVNSKENDDIIKVKNIQKIYPNGFQAIHNQTFGVSRGQIFGLLGPNGAGKSTTFNILTSFIPKTRGEVVLMGNQVDRIDQNIYQNVGITPQFDPLWENLTVKEHLRIYGNIKGLTGTDLDESFQYFMKVMQLNDYENVEARYLSGGNKRKLCVSLALIGSPVMQFFDEPSSGVDPIARRFLWNCLRKSSTLLQSGIVLTTHSMNEAESLCTKIGILINGKFHCIGTPQDLKNRFGQGYSVTLILKDNISESEKLFIINSVQMTFKQAQLINNKEEQDQMMFNFPNENFSFHLTYQFFYDKLMVENQYLKDFSITQSSLEQIFIYFSSFQKKED